MRTHTFFLPLAAALVVVAAPAAIAAESTLAFRDADAAHTLQINPGRNRVIVRGGDVKEIHANLKSDSKPTPARPDGLRVLTPTGGLSLSLRSPNTAVLDAGGRMNGRRGGVIPAPAPAAPRGPDATVAIDPPGTIEVTVPRDVSVVVRNGAEGDISISDVSGDVEVSSSSGKVELKGLRGGAVVETNRGDVDASFAEVSGKKPLSFTSFSGAVVVRVPRMAKADIRLRSQDGEILTDFPESDLVVRTETAPGKFPEWSIPSQMTGQAAQALKEAQKLQEETISKIANSELGSKVITRVGAMSLTSGQVVRGALNGGGTEIAITTIHGDVTLRKL